MKLEKLYYCYGLDTSCFYTDEEHRLERKINNAKRFKEKLSKIEKKKYRIQSKDRRAKYKTKEERKELDRLGVEFSERWYNLLDELYGFKEVRKYVNKYISQNKKDLIALQRSNMNMIRTVRYDKIHNKRGQPSIKRRVSIFDSTLTRCLGLKERELNTEIVIITVFFFPVAENIIHNGFYMNGYKYAFFSASAGQIRTKKFVAVRQDLLEKNMNTLTAGLSIDQINNQGGMNINKYMSYLSLNNSGTDEWKDFDIDRCIVVDDFETNVAGTVDYIDDSTFEITRQTTKLPIAQMDGAGVMLPSVMKQNTMIRAPWIKGLLSPFDFRKFIEDNNAVPVITDIYGDKHDVISEDIRIIFTKSQFKLWKYYPNWQKYKENFKKYGCQAALCNKEDDDFAPAVTSYQMIQTLPDLTDDELTELISTNVEQINLLATDKETMLKTMGIVKGKPEYLYSGFQKCLALYPELLSDVYCRRTVRDLKKKLENSLRAAKFAINGKYTFVVPDLYAFCEWLFLGIKEPKGILQDGEVCCRLFENGEKLDCLRSPHLYCEHPIRMNRTDIDWFRTNAIYISSHDYISRILQNDFDGDKLLVTNNSTLIQAAERNTKDKVSLYYIMRKANIEPITPASLWQGLSMAFTGGNIGEISNTITKIWNGEKITEEKIQAIKWLVMLNNYQIDYAKTLYKPTQPVFVKNMINQYASGKVPFFFIFAKGKGKNNVSNITNSPVNRLYSLYKPKSLSFNFKQDNIGKFDYRTLLSGDSPANADEITAKYKEVVREQMSFHTAPYENRNYLAVYEDAKNNIISSFPDNTVDEIVNAIVVDIFERHKSLNKKAFWQMFANEVYKNILNNLDHNSAVCERCNKRFVKNKHNQKYCPRCQGYIKQKSKEIVCCDCGISFSAKSTSRSLRCPSCQKLERKRINHNYYKKSN